jgi:two-component system OmpR family sensor kinase
MKPRAPRRPSLRARVLLGVLAVTFVALVGFDLAAVNSLRGYLLNQQDGQLQSVTRAFYPRPGGAGFPKGALVIGPAISEATRPPNGRSGSKSTPTQGALRYLPSRGSITAVRGKSVSPKQVRLTFAQILSGGDRLDYAVPSDLRQYRVAFIANRGVKTRSEVLLRGPGLQPAFSALPPGASWIASTVPSVRGGQQLRMWAVRVGPGTLVTTTSMAGVNKTVGRLRLIVIIGSLAALLLVGLCVAWLVRRGLRPIETMANQADRITAGDLTERVPATESQSEVGRLGVALNGMLARIEASLQEREASQELTRRFFADASHELRNPLASLRANAELYQQGALTSRAQVDEAMARIAHEAKRMSHLVDDMLRLARLDQHPCQQQDEVDVTALVQECAMRAQIADPARTWRADADDHLVVVGDEELLRRAIDNLLANVQAHTPDGTVATVTAGCSDDGVTVSVSDDGPGVQTGQLPHLFDRFYRPAASSSRPGSGLGLAIVTAVAAAHDGTAEASLNEPHGLRVTLALPASRAAVPVLV